MNCIKFLIVQLLFSRIICDSWLLMEFPLPEAAENLILKATKLRNTWDNLLKLKLEGIDIFCSFL